MTEQLLLPIRQRRTERERAADDADALRALLRQHRHFSGKSAETLCSALGWKDRRLRRAAEASDGRILSAPGVTGYRLAETTPVESYYQNERARYLSQIEQMRMRILAMDRAVHHHSPSR